MKLVEDMAKDLNSWRSWMIPLPAFPSVTFVGLYALAHDFCYEVFAVST
jgi:hypothetical protein